MKQLIGILLFTAFISGLSSCFVTSVPKPDNLVPKDEFIKMMVDVYLVQGINIGTGDAKELEKVKVTQTDLYYSVLKKYSVADTVFVRSLIYYSSYPKEYEKMHLQIMNILNESELQFKPREQLNTKTE